MRDVRAISIGRESKKSMPSGIDRVSSGALLQMMMMNLKLLFALAEDIV